jgi:histone H3/H4
VPGFSVTKIPKTAIKKLVNRNSDIRLTDKAAEAISSLLEKKAQKIARYAVIQAKKKGRKTILKEDIDTYRLKFGD